MSKRSAHTPPLPRLTDNQHAQHGALYSNLTTTKSSQTRDEITIAFIQRDSPSIPSPSKSSSDGLTQQACKLSWVNKASCLRSVHPAQSRKSSGHRQEVTVAQPSLSLCRLVPRSRVEWSERGVIHHFVCTRPTLQSRRCHLNPGT